MTRRRAAALALVALLAAAPLHAQSPSPSATGTPAPAPTPCVALPSLCALDTVLAPVLEDLGAAIVALDASGGFASEDTTAMTHLEAVTVDAVRILDGADVAACARPWASTLRTAVWLLGRSIGEARRGDREGFGLSGPSGFNAMRYAQERLRPERDAACRPLEGSA